MISMADRHLGIAITIRGGNSHHANVSLRVLFDDRWEDTIPVGSTKVSGRTKGGDSIFFSTDVLDLKIKRLNVKYGIF